MKLETTGRKVGGANEYIIVCSDKKVASVYREYQSSTGYSNYVGYNAGYYAWWIDSADDCTKEQAEQLSLNYPGCGEMHNSLKEIKILVNQ